MTFLSLLTSALSCVFYGVIIAAAIMAILYAVLKAFSYSIVRSVLFYITGGVMSALLIVQCSLLVGAIDAKGYSEPAKIYLNQVLEGKTGTIGAQDSLQIIDIINENYPIIGTYIGVAGFSGKVISEKSGALYDRIVDYLNTYIWHWVIWIIGIIVVACIIVVCFEKKEYALGCYEDDINVYPEYYN